MKSPRVHFAFAIPEGPNAGLSSSGWRVWTHGEDTYITAKSLAGSWKVSLHGDEAWRLAVTTENYRSDSPMWSGPDRAPWKFEATPFVDGKRLAFVVAVLRHALLPGTPDPKEIQIPVSDSWDQLTKAEIWMTEPGIELDEDHMIGGPLLLDSGRRVWVNASAERVEAIEPEPQAVSAVIAPLIPGVNDVAAPGVLLSGVRLDAPV